MRTLRLIFLFIGAHAHTRTRGQTSNTCFFSILILYVYIIYVYVYIVVVCVGGKRRVPGFFSAIIHRRASPCCSIALPAPIAVLKGKNNIHCVFVIYCRCHDEYDYDTARASKKTRLCDRNSRGTYIIIITYVCC